jgi:hypothetical protein
MVGDGLTTYVCVKSTDKQKVEEGNKTVKIDALKE